MGMLIRNKDRGNFLVPTLQGVDDLVRHFLGRISPDLVPELMPDPGAVPGIELEIADQEVVAKLPLPGYTNEEINVEVVGDYLTVRAEHKTDFSQNPEHHYLRRERSFSAYEESIKLPVRVQGGKTAAKYLDGVLTVTLPRETAEKPHAHVVKIQK